MSLTPKRSRSCGGTARRLCAPVQLLCRGGDLEVAAVAAREWGWAAPLLSGMGRRSCQSKVGGYPPPFHWWTSCPREALWGQQDLSLLLEAQASGVAPHSSRPVESAPLGLKSRPRPGPCERGSWAPLVWHGLGLPCPACLFPGSSWVPLGPGFHALVWCPQTLSRLSLGLPSGSFLGLPHTCLASCHTWDGPSAKMPRPEGPPDPCHYVPATM